MQLNSTAQSNSLLLTTNLTKKPKIILENGSLKQLQKRVALATITIPLLVSILAISFVGRLNIGAIEVGLLVSLYFLSMIGISVGFHRHFTHCAFQTHPSVRILLAILGSMAAQGAHSLGSNHRRHHQYSDQLGDPHSPYLDSKGRLGWLRGLWHAHTGWMLGGEVTNSTLFAKDLLRDPTLIKVNQLYLLWVILGLVIPAILGTVLSRTPMGFAQGLLWGGFVRIFLAHQATWSINSITHFLGSRPFETREQSTNNGWLAIPTVGEAWHNNHHAFPHSAKFGLAWWQIDPGYWVIQALERIGLAWEIKVPTLDMIKAKKAA